METMVKKAMVFVLISFILVLPFAERANAAFDCLTLKTSSSQSDKNYCQNELAQIEAQLNILLDQQKEQQKQTGTLKGDVNYLTSQINALKTKIKARAMVISQLKVNIAEKVSIINSLSEKVERDLESYASIKQAVKTSVDIINGVKVQTEATKQDLEKKQDAETDAKSDLESAQKKVAQSEAEKKALLAISKNKEAEYQRLAAQKKIRADRIRSALFPLAGISQKIEFGTALAYANDVKAKLVVDPAFLLAILTQESNLGANVGQCYLTNPDTGAGVGKNTGTIFANVMKPTRDVEP